MFNHQAGIERVRVVVVQKAAFLISQIIVAFIVIIVVDDRNIIAKTLFQTVCQCCFAAACTASYANHHDVIHFAASS